MVMEVKGFHEWAIPSQFIHVCVPDYSASDSDEHSGHGSSHEGSPVNSPQLTKKPVTPRGTAEDSTDEQLMLTLITVAKYPLNFGSVIIKI